MLVQKYVLSWYKYAHTHIYVYYTYTCIHMCIIYLYDIHTIAYKHMYIHTYVHTHIYAYAYVYTYVCTHACTNVYRYVQVYIYIDVDMEIDMHGLKLADSWWCFLRCGTFWRTVRTYHSQYTVGYKFSFGEIYDHWPRSMDPYMLGKPGWMFGSRLVENAGTWYRISQSHWLRRMTC